MTTKLSDRERERNAERNAEWKMKQALHVANSTSSARFRANAVRSAKRWAAKCERKIVRNDRGEYDETW
jgi:hypothetical protein